MQDILNNFDFEVVITFCGKCLGKYRHDLKIFKSRVSVSDFKSRVSVSDFLMKSRSRNLGLDYISISNTVKLPVLIGICSDPHLFGHEPCIMTERVLSQVQTAERGFLRRAHGEALRCKVRSCEIRKAFNVYVWPLLLRIERHLLR